MGLKEITAFMESRKFVGNTVHIDTGQLRGDLLKAAIAWVESLGVASKDVRHRIALVHRGGEWELHLSKFRLGPAQQGGRWLDVAHEDVVSEPLIIQLGSSPSLPDFSIEALA